MTNKYLNDTGVKIVWDTCKNTFATKKELDNYVTTNTEQTVSSDKTFNNLNISSGKTLTFKGDTNTNTANIKFGTVNSKNPYIGYATDQSDGTFVWSLTGTTYNTGLAIGGGSGNLLWKGTRVATTADIKTYNNATTSAAGLMSASDKQKLDGVSNNANNYTLPTATATTLGGVIVDNVLSTSSTNPVQNKVVKNAITDLDSSYNSTFTAFDERITNKQDTLVSGTNIKTINGQSLLGSGNIVIEGSSSSNTRALQVGDELSGKTIYFNGTPSEKVYIAFYDTYNALIGDLYYNSGSSYINAAFDENGTKLYDNGWVGTSYTFPEYTDGIIVHSIKIADTEVNSIDLFQLEETTSSINVVDSSIAIQCADIRLNMLGSNQVNGYCSVMIPLNSTLQTLLNDGKLQLQLVKLNTKNASNRTHRVKGWAFPKTNIGVGTKMFKYSNSASTYGVGDSYSENSFNPVIPLTSSNISSNNKFIAYNNINMQELARCMCYFVAPDTDVVSASVSHNYTIDSDIFIPSRTLSSSAQYGFRVVGKKNLGVYNNNINNVILKFKVALISVDNNNIYALSNATIKIKYIPCINSASDAYTPFRVGYKIE